MSSPTTNANGKRPSDPIEPYELLIGFAREADVIADRAKKHAKHTQEIAWTLVQEAKSANALARDSEFNAVQLWDRAKKATPEGVDFEALKAQPPAKPPDTTENTTKVIDLPEAEPGDDPEFDEAMMKAEQAAMEAAQEPEPAPEEPTLNGFPLNNNLANAEFENLLKAQVLKLTEGVYEATGQIEQVIEPGLCGRKNDIFDNKEMFKACTPRFFFNGVHKNWRRVGPDGWTVAATTE